MTSLPAGLRQPDARSCGAASLVAARMLLDPAYAAHVTTAGFAGEVLALHRRVTGTSTAAGRLQLPWPRVIGTPPWAVAHELAATGGPGLPPVPHAVHTVRFGGAPAARVRAGLATGRPVALYVGDRWLPRHVVLAVGTSGDSVRCYDPARGREVTIEPGAWAARRLPFGRWAQPWWVVAPIISA